MDYAIDAHTDIAVLGAGPAGASAALALAQHHDVTLIGSRPDHLARPGETLAGAARRLLTAMGLWDAFLAGPHTPCHLRQSRWGTTLLQSHDSVRDLDGPAWLVQRPHLEHLLADTAGTRGAHRLHGNATVTGHDGHNWHVTISGDNPRPITMTATVIIDATGRNAITRRATGAARRHADRLGCTWTVLTTTNPSPPATYVEAAPNGWWYTTSLGGHHRLLAFHTDTARYGRLTTHELYAHTPATLRDHIPDVRPRPHTRPQWCTANSGRLDTIAGNRWLAIGDCAMTFDPLSSQGLFHALYDGWTSPTVITRMLQNEPDAARHAQHAAESIWTAYKTSITSYYATEQRWTNQPFWAKRRAPRP